MFRAFVLPVLLMGMIGGPMLYSHHQRYAANLQRTPDGLMTQNSQEGTPWQEASYNTESSRLASVQNALIPSPGTSASADYQSTRFPQTAAANATNIAQQEFQASAARSLNTDFLSSTPSQRITQPVPVSDDQAWTLQGMTPDYAKAETIVFRGDANGPDLSQPMSFTPTIDLSSLFRFDISKQWITSRWDRVSTCPADKGLHGMRVALVTGTNSWDLHGSLTWYFDANHRVQRITYRGWTGDATRLLQTLQMQHQLRPQPTHWAGLYLSKRSGLMMKHPAVIDKNNPVQQLALILEINNPSGNSPLSNDFRSLLPAAIATQ